MTITPHRAASITAFLLIAMAFTQALYTALYRFAPDVDRSPIWSAEALIFTAMAAVAFVPLTDARRFSNGWGALGWGAIIASAILNVVQVGIGLTLFRPFFEAAGEVPAMMPAAQAIVAYSFFVYNAAKALLALAAIVFGAAQMHAGGGAAQALGGAAMIVGAIALIANAGSMMLGRDFLGDVPLAGGSGVLATVLLALCLKSAVEAD